MKEDNRKDAGLFPKYSVFSANEGKTYRKEVFSVEFISQSVGCVSNAALSPADDNVSIVRHS